MASSNRTRLSLSITPKIQAQLELISSVTGESHSSIALRIFMQGLGHAVGQAKAAAHGYRRPLSDSDLAARVLQLENRLEASTARFHDPVDASLSRQQRRALERAARKS